MAHRHGQAGRGEGAPLRELVGEGDGRLRGVKWEVSGLRHLSECGHVRIEVRDDPIRLIGGGQPLEYLLHPEIVDIDHGSESVQQLGHLPHLYEGSVDHPEQIANVGGGLGHLHDRDTARPVADGDERPPLVGRGVVRVPDHRADVSVELGVRPKRGDGFRRMRRSRCPP